MVNFNEALEPSGEEEVLFIGWEGVLTASKDTLTPLLLPRAKALRSIVEAINPRIVVTSRALLEPGVAGVIGKFMGRLCPKKFHGGLPFPAIADPENGGFIPDTGYPPEVPYNTWVEAMSPLSADIIVVGLDEIPGWEDKTILVGPDGLTQKVADEVIDRWS